MSSQKQSQKRPSDLSDIVDERSQCSTSPHKRSKSPGRSQTPCDPGPSTSHIGEQKAHQVKTSETGVIKGSTGEATVNEDPGEHCPDPPGSSKSEDTVSIDQEAQTHEESTDGVSESGPTACFLRDEPYNLQEELSRTTTYMWGQILSDAFDLSSRENNMPDSNVFLNNAAVMIRRGDAEEKKTVKLKIYLRSGATLAVAADYLERVESQHTKALSVYEQMEKLIMKTTGLLEKAPDGSQESRIEILCWKFQAWILFRKYNAMKNSAKKGAFEETQRLFIATVEALEKVDESERPEDTQILSNVLIEMNTNFAQMDMLRMAFTTWEHAEYLLNEAQDEGFFEAVESCLGKTINLLTAPKFFIRYVREFVFRIENFDNMI